MRTEGLTLIVALAAASALAAEPALEVSAPAAAVTVGDRVPVRVQARGGEGWLWGELTAAVTADGPWVVVDGPHEVAGAEPPAWELTLAPMKTGALPLPELRASVRPPDGPPRAVTVGEAASVQVASVLAEEGEAEPAPLRDPVGVHGLPWEWLVPLLIVLLPALALQHWWLRRRRRTTTEEADAGLPPLRQLEELATALEAGLPGAPAELVCDRLAAGLRRFLERRTGEPAQEMTSFELRSLARRLAWPEPVQRGLHRVMQLVDGVRFGRRRASDGELRQAIGAAVEAARGLDAHLTPAEQPLEAAS
jgi:hypothetical protein